ncbi:MAG: ABC transporter substrate-binding protein [Candidatus Caldatribacteriota bacterium]|nr:ABC transporter substrate-binding protein [Candidatus Caldatribacteriota bacterium]
MRNKIFSVLFILLISIVLISLTVSVSAKDKIVFADPGWDSVRFHNGVAQTIIEEGYGYPTEVISGSTAATFLGLKEGDIDAYMEIWTTNLEDIYYGAVEEGIIIETSINFNDNAQGLYVPTYIIKGDSKRGIEPMAPGLKTVKDLKDCWEVFKDEEDPSKGRIYGSPPGWAVDQILRAKVISADLDGSYNYFSPGSDSALSAAIVGAYEKGEPIVAYYWEPTWLMGMLDMTLLEDEPYSAEIWTEKNGYACEWAAMDIAIAVNKDLPERAPEVVEFLKNYHTTSAMASAALSYMMENECDTREAAVWFLKTREDVWTQWVSEEVAEKVKEAIK